MEIIAKENALVRLANKASTDLTGKEGHVAEYDGGLKLSGGTNALGVITDGGADYSGVAVLGAFRGTLRMKAGAPVTTGKKVVVAAGGAVKDLPAANGTYTVVGVALESGVADELVEIAPLTPQTVTIA